MIETIIGFHGTNFSNVDSIIKNNFKESKGLSHWLGEGVYFFIEGIGNNPINNAKSWAKSASWDNNKKLYLYSKIAVLSTVLSIDSDKYIDLTLPDGLKIFNFVRQQYIEKIKEAGKKINKDTISDYILIEKIKKDFLIDFIKNNFYIKFTEERKAKLNSRIPNVSVIAVSNPQKNINIIEVIEEGDIL